MNASATFSTAGHPLPATIPEYLDRLRRELAGADPALIQDALYDAEEYLRSELAENPGRTEAEVIASVAGSYGAPGEVADIYRETETRVQTALRAPAAPARRSLAGRFFGVALDPRAYTAMFYMLLSLATGIFYFTWVVTGISLSAGLSVLIIGIPFLIAYFATVRVLSLVEGRVVEVMLGERMPRRTLYAERGRPLLERIAALFTDPRTWATQLYFLLMLPLGIVYFVVIVAGLSVSAALIVAPVLWVLGQWHLTGEVDVRAGDFDLIAIVPWAWPLLIVAGIALLFTMLHLSRGTGRLHGTLAKHMLVRTAQYS